MKEDEAVAYIESGKRKFYAILKELKIDEAKIEKKMVIRIRILLRFRT